MASVSGYYPKEINITNCDREPIHIIGKSQAHGVIIACDKSNFIITRCSENSSNLLGFEAKELLDSHITRVFPQFDTNAVNAAREEKILMRVSTGTGANFIIITHTSEENLILDVEPVGESGDPVVFQDQLTRILNELNSAPDIAEMCDRTVSLVKSLFDYDRVMLYQFDEDWNGEVIAEEREPQLESWLGLHYPSTDIPKPSRDLFLKQGVRIISDVNYIPANLIPEISPPTNKPLDLSRSELRAVSPIHIEYLQNMKVGASLTAAVVLNGKLWGLLACHHYSPKFLNYNQRQSVKFLTQILTNRLAAKTAGIFLKKMEASDKIRKKLVFQMSSSGDVLAALTREKVLFTDIIDCSGGAIYINGELELVGKTPSREEVLQLIQDFLDQQKGMYATKNLQSDFSPASAYTESASGVLSIRLDNNSKDHIIWFREESSETVNWGGNPEKNQVVKEGVQVLSPRKSFEKWTQKVSGIAAPWEQFDLEAVIALQESITHQVVLHQKEEIAQLNTRLTEINKELEAFSYSVSHDLRAPLRGISGYAAILQEDYNQVLDEDGRKAVSRIRDSAREMNGLIQDLLSFAKIGKAPIDQNQIDTTQMVSEIFNALNVGWEYPKTEIIIDKNLPGTVGDPRLLYQLFSNIINNALKYSGKVEEPKVEIGCSINGEKIFFVRDNGIGFDPKFKDKIFNVFSRLAGDDYSGSGIGLAIAKKVIDKHEGRIWVESEPGKGSVFYFTLP